MIDQIGNRCYKLGLTADAQKFYEMGLKLRNAPQEASSSSEDEPEDSPDQTDVEESVPVSAEGGRTVG